MKVQLQLYTRKDCRLCEEMKDVVRGIEPPVPLTLEEIDIDSSAELQALYGEEVPVLFINGRKAFKYRLTPRQLEKRLRKEKGGWFKMFRKTE